MSENLNPHQFGEQMPMFNARPLSFPYAPATGPDKDAPKPPPSDAQNKHGVYLRFGDWPSDERSQNHVTGWKEEGVSAYDTKGGHYLEPEDPDPDMLREGGEYDEYGTNDTLEEMKNRRQRALRHPDQPSNRGHIVKGSMVGVGHDGEPLLRNVREVGEWPKDIHHFATGTQRELLSDAQVRTGKDYWSMSPAERTAYIQSRRPS